MSLRTSQQVKKPPVRTIIAMIVLLMVSALGVVYTKHQSRKLFVQLQSLHKSRDAMDIEWGQLQLEQSTLTTHGRVEGSAGAKLGMVIPDAGQVVILQP